MSGMAYIAVRWCGHASAASLDGPEFDADNSEILAGWAERGEKIERVTVEEARSRLRFPCDCSKEQLALVQAGTEDPASLKEEAGRCDAP